MYKVCLGVAAGRCRCTLEVIVNNMNAITKMITFYHGEGAF